MGRYSLKKLRAVGGSEVSVTDADIRLMPRQPFLHVGPIESNLKPNAKAWQGFLRAASGFLEHHDLRTFRRAASSTGVRTITQLMEAFTPSLPHGCRPGPKE